MKSEVAARLIECIDALIDEKVIRSYREFASKVDFAYQNLHEIKNAKRNVTIKLVEASVKQFHINANFLFAGNGPKFLSRRFKEAHELLVVPVDIKLNERVTHVANHRKDEYCLNYRDPKLIASLPSFSLPDMKFRSNSYRSFDVGDSMMAPSLSLNDRVICRFIAKQYWQNAIKDMQVYVVVTPEEVYIMRAINKLKTDFKILLLPDNSFFKAYSVGVEDILEVWLVETVMKNYDHLPSDTRPFESSMNSSSIESTDTESFGEDISDEILDELKQFGDLL